jgi:arylsulfatase A-like enzyme/Tfp pilus assembly protein PilF
MTRALGLAFLGSFALAACGADPVQSVLLVTLDTTRADALGAYGARPSVTPRLDQLASEGVTFDWARTVTPTTLPAHTSMLTGLYPHRHTVRDNSLSAVPLAATTVAERASAAGLATAAFVSAKVLDRAFGLDQGFARYSQPPREQDVVSSTGFSARSAAETVAEASAWLGELPADQPFFAWVHLFDPHRPWVAGEPWKTRAKGNPYLAEIAATDDAVGRLLDALRASGRYERTTIVVVGDHGEGLGEHGEDSHAYFVYDSTLRVPLILRRADGARAGERVDSPVTVADIGPTLCEALGISNLPDADGMSLFAVAPPPSRGVYFESYYGFLHYGMAPLAGWADSRGKYIHATAPEFYEPLRAPREPRNLIAENAQLARSHLEALAQVLARPALPAGTSLQNDAELLRGVRELGYASAATLSGPLPDPLAASELPSPHARAIELRTCEQAQLAFELGRFADTERMLAGVLEENPSNTFALEYLAHAQLRLGKLGLARTSFENALSRGPERASTLRGLGVVLQQQGDRAGAVTRWTRAAELDPSDLETLRMLLQSAQEAADSVAESRWRETLKRASAP